MTTNKLSKLIMVSGMTILLTACAGAKSSSNPGANQGAGTPNPTPNPNPNPNPTPTCNDGTQACAFLNAHNQARAAVVPAPSTPIPALTYSSALEAAASTWAQSCNFTYSPTLGSQGQNVFASTGPFTPENIVGKWTQQAADYTYSTNSCASGKICGNYTQVVWRSSTEVGCAIQQCTTGTPFTGVSSQTWYFAVCNYSPGGNFIGLLPY